MISHICRLIAVLFGVVFALPAHAQSPAALYAIQDARVIAAPGQNAAKATIVIRDGMIEACGSEVKAPPGAHIIDGTGLVVYAGFIDCGAQFGVKPPPAQMDQDDPIDRQEDVQVTMREALRRGIRPELRSADWIVPDEQWSRHRQIGFTAALLAPGGGFLEGWSALTNLTGLSRRASLVNDRVFLHVSLLPQRGEGQRTEGPRPEGRRPESVYPGTLMGALAHVRQVFLDAQWYRDAWEAYRSNPAVRRPPRDEVLESLASALESEARVVFRADNENDIRRALMFADEFDLKPVILGGREGCKVAPELARRKVPVILTLDFGREPREPKDPSAPAKPEEKKPDPPVLTNGAARTEASRSGPQGETGRTPGPELGFELPSPPLRWQKEQRRLWEEKLANAARLQEAGVMLAVSASGSASPSDFSRNLRRAINAGWKSQDALAALTRNAAQLCGCGQMGTVGKGMIANLTVMTDSFDSERAKVKCLFIDGKLFEPDKERPATPARPSPGESNREEGDDQ